MRIRTKILIFTLTEAVAFAGGVYLWFAVSPLVGVGFWTVVTFFEHSWAFNTGAGKPFFSIPE